MDFPERERLDGACVAFGCFDGMHRGHRAVLNRLAEESRRRGCPGVLLTCPAKGPALTTEAEKARIAREAGIKRVISCPDGAFGDLSGARAVILGEGNPANVSCERVFVETVYEGGAPITAERLYQALDGHDPETYAALCGRPYRLSGTVVHGKALGRTVGMPTANLEIPPEKRIPPDGVYATLTHLQQGAFAGLTNIGRRPSVDDEERITIETNLFDFDADLYGAPMELDICFYIRDVMKFDGLQAVRRQVRLDSERSREKLKRLMK